MYLPPTYFQKLWLTISQIVYLSIVGPLMLAAFFEWVLWLAAFTYCLIKVYQKADHWSIRVLAGVMVVLFILLR
jgi:chitin synthase